MRAAVLALLLTLLLVAGCGPSAEQIQATVEAAVSATVSAQQEATAAVLATAEADTCSDARLATYTDELERLLDRYENQTEVVASTPRVGLGTPLQRLIDYEDEARDIDVPECLTDYHAAVIAMMEAFRDAYQTFAAQGSQAVIEKRLADGRQLLADIRGAIPDLREGVLPGEISIP